MNIRDRIRLDHGIDVRISAGSGRREDPYVIEDCSAAEAALTQMQLLRGLGLGVGNLWRIIEWLPCDAGAATEVIRIETVRFTEDEIETTTRGLYFDTRAVTGQPHALHPLISWRGPSDAPVLPFELGWLHFDKALHNATPDAVDETLFYSAPGAKASVYIYSRQAEGRVGERDAELARVAAMAFKTGMKDPWPVIESGTFALKYFLSEEDLSLVGVANYGPHFIKVRLTYIDDPKMREMMSATVGALSACLVAAQDASGGKE